MTADRPATERPEANFWAIAGITEHQRMLLAQNGYRIQPIEAEAAQGAAPPTYPLTGGSGVEERFRSEGAAPRDYRQGFLDAVPADERERVAEGFRSEGAAPRAEGPQEDSWNDDSPESGATATASSAVSAPSATRSGDDSTVCPRCRHASHASRCTKAMKNAGEEFECGCGAASRAEGLDVERLAAAIQVVRDYDDDYDAADEAQQIAAEYLASRPSDEVKP